MRAVAGTVEEQAVVGVSASYADGGRIFENIQILRDAICVPFMRLVL